MKKIISIALLQFFILIALNTSAKDTPYIIAFNGSLDSTYGCTYYYSVSYCSSIRMLARNAVGGWEDSTDWYLNAVMIARTYGNDTFFATKSGNYTAKVYQAGYILGPGWSCGFYSASAIYVSFKAPCHAPITGFFTGNISPNKATVNWEVLSCAVAYKVKYRVAGTNQWIVKSENQNDGSKKLKGLLPATTYDWEVKTKCTSDPKIFSAYSASQTFTTLSGKLSNENPGESSMEFSIYPNPAASSITIDHFGSGRFNIKITDLLGVTVFEQHSDNDNLQSIPVSAFPSGIYFITLSDDHQTRTEQFIKN